MQSQVSELQHTVSGLSLTMQEQFAGGINYIKNSAGLNGITDDWTTSGTVSTDSSTGCAEQHFLGFCIRFGRYLDLNAGHYWRCPRHPMPYPSEPRKPGKLHILFPCDL